MDPKSLGREGSKFLLTRHSGLAILLYFAEQEKLTIPKERHEAFLGAYKKLTVDMLENSGIRIVSEEMLPI